MKFEALKIQDSILKALKDEGYESPTPIQEQAIPVILDGRDLLGCAQTGTGKTAAFAIPIIQLLSGMAQKPGGRKIKSLILTPTRELAIQIGDSFKSYGKYNTIRHTVVFGGVPQRAQTDALRAGVDVLIATPGRLLDLINQGFIKLNDLEIFVLDEADRMLDMGFVHDVKKVLTRLPASRQNLFFSATMPSEIVKLADAILVRPAKVEVTPVSSTAKTVGQGICFVEKADKRKLLAHLLEEHNIERALVFTKTKHGADRVAKDLLKVGIKAEAIHGNKSQNARQRALAHFKSGEIRVLAATDIAARGIDIDELSHVFNFDLPNVPETYVHRIGRTGRAGASGFAFSFCDGEEKAFLKDIQKLIAVSIPVVEHPFFSGVFAEVPAQAKSKDQSQGQKKKSGWGGQKKWHAKKPVQKQHKF